MDNSEIISDSIEYARNALVGNWKTWLIFIICSLPFALMVFLFDPEKIKAAKTIDWSLFPWGQLCALLLAGFLLSFFTTGYLVRVWRGTTPPPEFGDWVSLFLDGIKVMIVQILWFIPAAVVLCITVVFFVISFAVNGSALAMPMRIASLLLVVIEIALIVLTVLCTIIALVRYARTGSIREGIRYSAVMETIRAIGWGSYIIALIVLLVTAIIFFLVISVIGLIPYIGWVINLALDPLFAVFSARYLSRVYDSAAPPASPVISGPAEGI